MSLTCVFRVVCLRYTFGQPVEGIADITISSITSQQPEIRQQAAITRRIQSVSLESVTVYKQMDIVIYPSVTKRY